MQRLLLFVLRVPKDWSRFFDEVRLEGVQTPQRKVAKLFQEIESAFSTSLFPAVTLFVAIALITGGVISSTPVQPGHNIAEPTASPSKSPTKKPSASPSQLVTSITAATPFKANLTYKNSWDEPLQLAPFDTSLFSIEKADSVWVVANKSHPLNPLNYVPKRLVTPKFKSGTGSAGSQKLQKVAATAIAKLAKSMSAAGRGKLYLNSGYRSYSTQAAVHAADVAALGVEKGERLAARPGFSEHQTGLAVDVSAPGQSCVIQKCFGGTKAGRWIRYNAWKYGFIVRYPDGQTNKTGYQYEPWHLRYVGLELAAEMHRQGEIVLEDFWGLEYAPGY